MTLPSERAKKVIDELCNDPKVWLTHGLPRFDKLEIIERKIAEAIEAAQEDTYESCGHMT